MTQLLASKGLSGYIDGRIQKPGPKSIPLPDTISSTQLIITPIYSSNPSFDEWVFWDQLTQGHITLNCMDVVSLGVVTTGSAKDAWNSIQAEWVKSTDMRRSHAQETLNRTEYTEGTDIQEHIKLL
jgi:gag-polypeptide of LTR copia-type